jgi:hypothetical protein
LLLGWMVRVCCQLPLLACLSPARTRFKEITNWAKIGFC